MFSDTLGKMDANDACEIYNFTDNIPVAHQRAKATKHFELSDIFWMTNNSD